MLAACVGMFAAGPALGWGEAGHRIISRLATERLSPETRQAVESLLDGRTIEEVSLWADEVRKLPEYQWSAPLHYVNVPPHATAFDMARDCPPEGCVVAAIIRFRDVLRDPAADRRQRQEALKFLIHFVMDVHQPLHVGRKADRGGNDIKVVFEGRQTDLHAVWDTLIIESAGPGIDAHATAIRRLITPETAEAWAGCLDPAEWATESFRLARDWAYRLERDGRIGPKYTRRALDICNRRLAQAAVRLAAMLEDLSRSSALSQSPASIPSSTPADSPELLNVAAGAGVP